MMDIWEESGNRLIWRSDELLAEFRKRGPYKPRKTLVCECGWEGKRAKRIVERRMRTCIRFAPCVEVDLERRVCPKCGKSRLKYKE
jgi:hypothetical protein